MGRITNNISPINSSKESAQHYGITGTITYGNGNAVPTYKGQYQITPLAFEETTLKTKGKKLTEDVVIKEIPYFETTNLSGGYTVYIAGQIEFE